MDVFKQGKEEKPRWKWVVQKQHEQTKDVSFESFHEFVCLSSIR